jgi:hypothetical protein
MIKPPKQPKKKKCRVCENEFYPYQSTQSVCNLSCAIEYAKVKTGEEEKKQWFKEKAKIKERLKTHKDWIQDLQIVFNEFIRLRDIGKPCICCGKQLTKVFHAGHFFSTGAYPNLRFDEDNCHGQREDCNLHKHGNGAEYAINLPRRIGKERFSALYERRSVKLKLSIPEIKEKINYYKNLIKTLKQK